MATTLPEGTDRIIAGAAATAAPDRGASETETPAETRPNATEAPRPADAKAAIGDAKARIGDAAAGLRGQATDRAREYALMGKDKAAETLHGVSQMIDDAAAAVEEKVGAQYGDYARQAAATVRGFATGLEGKDVDELFAQARDAVAKSPAIAIGAAAAIGFVLSRVVKAGFEPPVPSATGGAANDVGFTPDPKLGAED